MKVGWAAQLMTRQHGISGRVVVTSPSLLTVTQFNYDGGGLRGVRDYTGSDGTYFRGTAFGP